MARWWNERRKEKEVKWGRKTRVNRRKKERKEEEMEGSRRKEEGERRREKEGRRGGRDRRREKGREGEREGRQASLNLLQSEVDLSSLLVPTWSLTESKDKGQERYAAKRLLQGSLRAPKFSAQSTSPGIAWAEPSHACHYLSGLSLCKGLPVVH